MTPSFIYFDLDNTLLDHSSAEEKAQFETYHSFPELQQVAIEEWLETYRLVNHSLWERYQNGEVDRLELQHSRFYDSMNRLKLECTISGKIGSFYMQNYRKHWSWIDGARSAFSDLAERFEVGIITNGFKETQQLKFEHLELKNYCDVMIISEEIGQLKPHPDVFDAATERAGVSRDEILYVGDSYTSDIVGGRNAGWQTAWFTGLNNIEIKKDQTADFQFNRFDELVELLS
ncbi:MAG: HAD family hydrolase [Balneolaceae bacterium]